jgi:polysaccharide biosynthesis/export protein
MIMKAIHKFQSRSAIMAVMVTLFCSFSCAVQTHNSMGRVTKNKVVVAADSKTPTPAAPKEKRVRVAKNSKSRSSTTKVSASAAPEAKVEEKSTAIPAEAQPAAKAQPVKVSMLKMDYRLGFGDVLDLKFLGSSEYNETVTVRPDGKISLQGIGEVDVLGLTPAELDTVLTLEYAKILVNPNVAVIVKNFGGQRVFVAGEVEKPGAYDITKGMTLLRAIAGAGGHKKTAKLGSVILIRLDDEKRAEATRVDLSLHSMAKTLSRDIPVQANDIIYVPRTIIADIDAFMSQIYNIVLPPFDSWARFYYFQEVVK